MCARACMPRRRGQQTGNKGCRTSRHGAGNATLAFDVYSTAQKQRQRLETLGEMSVPRGNDMRPAATPLLPLVSLAIQHYCPNMHLSALASNVVAVSLLLVAAPRIRAAPSKTLAQRDDCQLKTNPVSNLYELAMGGVEGCKDYTKLNGHDFPDGGYIYAGKCADWMVGRIACAAQPLVDNPSDKTADVSVYRCVQEGRDYYRWKRQHICSKNKQSGRDLSGLKTVEICAYAGSGDDGCCGSFDFRQNSRATCDKQS